MTLAQDIDPRGLRQPAGAVIASYKVGRFLGEGLEGPVYLATDMRTGELRTLKLLRGRQMQPEAEHIAKFYRRLAGVTSVKQLRECGVLRGQRGVGVRPWLAFDYVRGRTLAEVCARGRGCRPLEVIGRVLEALHPVHARGMAIGDFDHGRNLLVEEGTRRIVFCDLDAGERGMPAWKPKTDLEELALLVRRGVFDLPGNVRGELVRRLLLARSLSRAQQEIAVLLRRLGSETK
jgi:serine/threonine protein kinase